MKLIVAISALLCISIAPLTAAPKASKSKVNKSSVSSAKPSKPVEAKAEVPVQDEAELPVEENAEIVIVLDGPVNQAASKSAGSSVDEDDSFLDPDEQARENRRTELSREALSHRGTPYVWGGYGRNGFDCSGFTAFIYAKRGVKLPHSAKKQFTFGEPVDKSDLQEGDLVFFNTRGPLTHVGMYIGDGEFVHAANKRRGVTVDKLSDAYYAKRYAGARRIG